MVINAIVSIIAILALTFIEYCLLDTGTDGTLSLLVVTAIAGLAGYNVRGILSYLKSKNGGSKNG